ncbi:uncharacterized protein KY384_004972 [Bacidia gigantensis]|uniref:uncharacterized protein n=1 Tax=Bacidia gigantensis TaxID=2732470 RepID=UPI001D0595BA|nr:uncharacterized protein KY384_004972 [Bacidia gigantensis]KAG8530469.1 hypothetical protein KY384_004972 [Bacidia gigantensis]
MIYKMRRRKSQSQDASEDEPDDEKPFLSQNDRMESQPTPYENDNAQLPLRKGQSRARGVKTGGWINSRAVVSHLICSCLVALAFYIFDPFSRSRPVEERLDEQFPINSTIPPRDWYLAPFTFDPLPLGSIKPEGWLKDQLTLMSHGLVGHQWDFYPIVKNSPWIGGHSEYSPLNEGLPYWYNGLVPLAYAMDDPRLHEQVLNATRQILEVQWPDGWLGPERSGHRDLWSRFPFCLGLRQLVEAKPDLSATVVPAMYKFVHLMHSMLKHGGGFWDQWGLVRYPDMIATLQWLHENHPSNQTNSTQVLFETMHYLHKRGFDWPGYWTKSSYLFRDLDTIKPPINGDTFRFRHTHAVNVGQGLSAGAALYRFTRNESLLEANRRGVNWTFTYHGDVAGSIIGDERQSGLGPNRGSELCTTVETMYSLSYLYQVMGDREFADRCELAAFNSLAVAVTPDHWARAYLNAANEPMATRILGRRIFWNTGPESLVFGTDTNYPCCTVNLPQGLPKFLSTSFVRVGENGLGHAILSPAAVSATTKSGSAVNISCSTNYPFGHSLRYAVDVSKSFDLHLRVPSWAQPDSDISVDASAPAPLFPDSHTGMTTISLDAGAHELVYNLRADLRIIPRGNGSVTVYHGALLYALDIGQDTEVVATSLAENENLTYSVFDQEPILPKEVQTIEVSNTKAWNIGIDPDTLSFHYTNEEKELPNPIYDYHAPPSHVTGKGCQVAWTMKMGLPAALPELPRGQTKRKCEGGIVDVILRPYGSLKVHMAELPVVDLRTAPDYDEQP